MTETLFVVCYLLIGAGVLGVILCQLPTSEVKKTPDLTGLAIIVLWPLVVMILFGVWIGRIFQ